MEEEQLNGTSARMDDLRTGQGTRRGKHEETNYFANPGLRIVWEINIE